MSIRGVVAIVVLVALIGPATAGADVQRLSSSGGALSPAAAFTDDGGARLAWTETTDGGGAIALASLAPGASAFAAPVSALTGTSYERAPTVGFDGRGLSVTVVQRSHAPYRRARAVIQRADGAYLGAVTLSAKGHSAGIPTVAVARDGSAVAAWRWYDGTVWIAQAALRPAGGVFGPPIDLPATHGDTRGGNAFAPKVSVSPGGRVALAWESDGELRAVTGTTSGLGAPQLVGTYRPNYGPFAVAVGDTGRAIVTWVDVLYARGDSDGPDGPPTTTKVALSGPDGAFAPAEPFPFDGSVGDDGPAVAVTSDGTALLGIAATISNHHGALYTASAPPEGSMGAAAKVADTGTYTVSPHLSAGPAGDALLTYTVDAESADGDGIVSVVNVARRPAGGAFGPSVALSDPAEEALDPVAALGPAGRAIVSWVQSPSGGGDGNLDAVVLAGP